MSREDIMRMAREAQSMTCDDLDRHECAVAEVERLRAALAEPVQEPVRAYYTIDEINAKFDPPQHKPLTTEEVEQLWAQSSWQGRANIGFARAIEKAHGIGV